MWRHTRRWLAVLLVGSGLLLLGCMLDDSVGLPEYDETRTGDATSRIGCKAYVSTVSPSSCIEYEYAADRCLRIRHIDTPFNCCPESMGADVEVNGAYITITLWQEFGPLGGCTCLCLFDMEYEVRDLPMGTYILDINEAYTMGEKIRTTLVLDGPAGGTRCWERTGYPWVGF